MKTYSAKPSEVNANWWIIDAEGVVLGRLATEVSKILRGKNKPMYTPHIDTGDNVIIINCEKVKMTGRKKQQKVYYHHTGHPGGIKERSAEFVLSTHPDRIIRKAVERMMPEGPLGEHQFAKLRVYQGTEHPHAAQQPKVYDFAAKNPKNKR
ncbi:MAG TPA: 50S ribosomal protein L13 [Rickettsiales bacterium]|nr:50S ribosomal protein L13 [Rickettsiales bacterium]